MLHGSIRHDYTGRRRKKKVAKGEVYKKYKPKAFVEMKTSAQPYRRDEGVEYKSFDSGIGVSPKVESQKYTGTLVKGIATMHKSNAVPIIDDQQAKDISQMRRN